MKRISLTAALTALVVTTTPVKADEMFTGDVKLACEATLCLSSGTRPSECTPAINKYFSIKAKKMSNTIKKRKNFLELCPTATEHRETMGTLADAITNGAGRCDSAALNATLLVWKNWDGDTSQSYISDQLPGYCSAYLYNENTDIKIPKYVGTPDNGGRWVD